ncbi:hypothetical protein [Helicobacter burdigaliensis]|uniref:hypothetical protein n=1 Tax=Helicobacter burdigaliensis TaxID=2315334 RepID=UPI000EF70BC2|nr:hypothetical protein [Helicobacter burdigaliensis]
MIAYVHIGTVKTGTTTIQSFLDKNRKILRKSDYYYPTCFTGLKAWELAGITKRDNLLYSTEEKRLSRIDVLKKNLQDIKEQKVILSSECFQEMIQTKEGVKELKEVLLNIGFSRIAIIIYLREPFDLAVSFYNTELLLNREKRYKLFENVASAVDYGKFICNHKQTLQWWGEVFGKENLIVRLFDKNEFKNGDLLKDFVDAIGLEWDGNFVIPEIQNETINLLGITLLRAIYLHYKDGFYYPFFQKYFQSKDFYLKFQPPKSIIQSYVDYFEESNEWVRKEFFPHKERLFPKKDLANYKENYELKEMKPEYWDRIAEFIADIVKIRNKIIEDKTNIIQDRDRTIKEKDIIIDNKITQINQIETILDFQTKYGTATQRIKNQLSYKLGQAMISNSKSLLGYIRMPYVLSYIKETHQKEQEAYQQSIKQNPNLKLPPLESYADYQEALKIKNHLTYKLGAALIKANNVRGGGEYLRILAS